MPTTSEIGANQLIEALLGVARVSANGNSTIKDDLSPAILILAELIASISAAAAVEPESRIELRARRLAEMENSLADLEPHRRATVARERLGLSKTGYYRDRAVAKNMRIL
jgi:hypothetical protein